MLELAFITELWEVLSEGPPDCFFFLFKFGS